MTAPVAIVCGTSPLGASAPHSMNLAQVSASEAAPLEHPATPGLGDRLSEGLCLRRLGADTP